MFNQHRMLFGALLATVLITASGCNFGFLSFDESEASKLQQLLARSAAAVQIVPGAKKIKANICGEFFAVLKTSQGTPIDLETQTQLIAVNIIPHSKKGHFSSIYKSLEDCENNKNSTRKVSMAKKTDRVPFFFKHFQAGEWTFEIAASGLRGDNYTFFMPGGKAHAIRLGGPSVTTVGECQTHSVDWIDASNNPADTSALPEAERTVRPSIFSGPGKVYANKNCTGAGLNGEALTLPAGKSSLPLYFKSTKPQTSTLRVLTAVGALTKSIRVSNGIPVALAIADPHPKALKAGKCYKVDVKTEDAFGNEVPVANPAGLIVRFKNPSGSTLKFYNTQQACTSIEQSLGDGSPSTFITIGRGKTFASFYLRNRKISEEERYTLSATNKAGQTLNASLRKSTRAGDPFRFKVENGSPTLTAGSCSQAYLVRWFDKWENQSSAPPNGIRIRLSGNSTDDRFYTNTNCAGSPVSEILARHNTQSIEFFYSSRKATLQQQTGTRLLTVDDRNTKNEENQAIDIAAGSKTLEVAPLPPSKIDVILQHAGRISADIWAKFMVRSLDAHGNLSNVAVHTPVSFSGIGDAKISTQPNGSLGGIALAPNTRTKVFYLQDTTVPTAPKPAFVSLRASVQTQFTASFTLGFSLYPGAPKRIEWNPGNNRTVAAGSCNTGAIILRDQHGNETGNHNGLTLSFNDGGSQSLFYNTTHCGRSGPVTVVRDQSRKEFRYTPRRAGSNYLFQVSAAGATDSFRLNVTGGNAARFIITPDPGPTTVSVFGKCARFKLTATDDFGNPTTYGPGAADIVFPNGEIAGMLFPDQCNGNGSSRGLWIPNTTTQSHFYFRASRVGQIHFTLKWAGFTGSYGPITSRRIDLDYATDGKREIDVSGLEFGTSRNDQARAVVSTTRDHTIVMGSTTGTNGLKQFAAVRLDKNGNRVNSFGQNGIVAFGLSPDGHSEALAGAVLNNGNILLAGYANRFGQDDMALAVIHPDTGQLLASRVFDLENAFKPDRIRAVTVRQTDNQIFMGGYSGVPTHQKMMVVNLAGNQLTSAPIRHYEMGPIGPNASVNAVYVIADGRIAAAGTDGLDFALVVLDAKFKDAHPNFNNGRGRVMLNFGGVDIPTAMGVVASNGSIVVAGTSHIGTGSQKIALAHFDTNGKILRTTQSYLGSSSNVAHSLVLNSNEQIIVGGMTQSGTNQNFALIRYNRDLTEDKTFGNNSAVVQTDFGGQESLLGLRYSGTKIHAVGFTQKNGLFDFAIGQYQAQ